MNTARKRIGSSLPIILLAVIAVGAVIALPGLSAARDRKEIIRDTMPAVVMVLAARVEHGRLVPVSSGSGTIVDANGSILTNHHVLYDDKNKRLHDVFLIGLFRSADQQPELVCAGKPSEGTLKKDVDLALIRCSLDRNGKPWRPSNWPTIPVRSFKTDDIVPGEQIWVLGYPNVGGSTIHVTAGLVSGWTDEHGGAGSRAFMKTDAAISHGNSGGTAIDADGMLVGIPTAIRETRTQQGGATVSAGRVGLIRPVDRAEELLAEAHAGGPGAAEAKSIAPGVIISSRVIDGSSKRPVEGALVIVFRPGIAAQDIAREKLEEQALTWGRTDANGEFRLDKPLARGQKYTVAVMARGFLPLTETDVLRIDPEAPSAFRAWGHIALEPERS
jgi:S1-C subfamily serine protease